jgi:SAM-dependent methyltransferase
MFERITSALDRRFYPGSSRIWDVERFAAIVRQHLRPEFRVLDFGAGRGKDGLLDFRDVVDHVAGVDIDDGVLRNPYLHERQLIEPGKPLDFADNTFDVVYSCNVLEHVDDPQAVIGDIVRVLKPGGLFLAKTPNRNHYVAWTARLTPTRFHRFANRLRGRLDEDTFATCYRCNSKRQLRRLVAEQPLTIEFLEFQEGRPEYLRIFPLTYFCGILYERIVNALPLLARFRAVMVFGLRKSEADRLNAVNTAA